MKTLGIPFKAVSRIKDPVHRRKVLDLVGRLAVTLPRRKILSLIGLSASRFASWSRQRAVCSSSPLALCRRSGPHQLTVPEVRAIKRQFSNPAFLSWPAVSIAWRLVTSGLVSANVSTIIRYAKIMGLDAARKVRPKSRKRGSFSAEKPNQAWHMDVTVVATTDNRKAYLQLILDNYSRKIIAWKVSSSVSGFN